MNVTRSDVFAKQIKYILMQVQRMKSEVLDATKKLEVGKEVVFKKHKSYINSHEYFVCNGASYRTNKRKN